ncbi:MAG TPA: alpha/beta fold hydrolase [Saprospiraceae bacterium]|nr:alpha/beta fold hydrolase [Saprospiraceae bacterium]
MSRVFTFLSFAILVVIGPKNVQGQNLIQAVQLQHSSAAEINILIQLTGDTTKALFGVTSYAIRYATTNTQGMPDTASGFVAFPDAGDIPLPVLFYQHGTASSRQDVPSRNSSEALLATIASSLGYITVAADYQGLGDSKGLHPYLHARSEAKYATDLFLSILPFMEQQSVVANRQVFITGYSQGGHAAMALHRALQEDPLPESYEVVAAAPMSGPYSVSGEMLRRVMSREPYNYPGYAIYTLLSYNSVYHLYDSLPQVLKAPYVPAAEAFAQEQITMTNLHQELLASLLKETGSTVAADLFQDSIIDNLHNPNNRFLLALQENDTYDWAPEVPTRLVYCMNDDQVVYTNALLADSVMQSNGAVDVAAVDVYPAGDHGACVLPAVKFTIDFFNQYRETTSRAETFWAEGTIYPNPAQRTVTLTGLPVGSVLILHNGLGQEILRKHVPGDQMLLQLPELSNGVYWITMAGHQGQATKKLLILQNP